MIRGALGRHAWRRCGCSANGGKCWMRRCTRCAKIEPSPR